MPNKILKCDECGKTKEISEAWAGVTAELVDGWLVYETFSICGECAKQTAEDWKRDQPILEAMFPPGYKCLGSRLVAELAAQEKEQDDTV